MLLHMVEMAMFHVQRAITPKVGKSVLWLMCSAYRFIVLYICVKFCENILRGFQLTERARVHGRNGHVQCSKGNNFKSRQTRVTARSARCLIVLYICVKFGENISDRIRIMEWTRMMKC